MKCKWVSGKIPERKSIKITDLKQEFENAFSGITEKQAKYCVDFIKKTINKNNRNISVIIYKEQNIENIKITIEME